MHRKAWQVGLLTVWILLAGTSVALAQEDGAAGQQTTYFMVAAFSAIFGLAIAAIGGATAQGKSIVKAVEGIARNPGAAADIRTSLIIGLALIESLVIYTLLVSLVLLFVDPFGLVGG